MFSKLMMKACSVYLIVALLVLVSCSAIPKPGDEKHKDRVMDRKLSEHDHHDSDDDEEEHNPEYDHDAFLGQDEAKNFDDLSPEESKKRLGLIVDKIDKDNDGQVTEQELKDWIQYVQKRYIKKDAERLWKDHDTDGDTLSWEGYAKRIYSGHEQDGEVGSDTQLDSKARDQNRWKVADTNGDGKLNFEEFINFMHPEDVPHMRDVVVQETMQDIDKDHDGFISIEEYIKDLYDEEDEDDDEDDDVHNEAPHDGEPHWVTLERDQFRKTHDRNGDGLMDKDEVKEWIMPEDLDHSETESKHLVQEADQNRDGILSKDEILEKYDLFVGSQATDFGEALTMHDEF